MLEDLCGIYVAFMGRMKNYHVHVDKNSKLFWYLLHSLTNRQLLWRCVYKKKEFRRSVCKNLQRLKQPSRSSAKFLPPAPFPLVVPLRDSLVLTSALAPFSPTEKGLYKYCSTAATFSGTPLLTLDSTFRIDCRSWVFLISCATKHSSSKNVDVFIQSCR